MIKRILGVVLVLIILMGVGGCVSEKREVKKDETVYTPEVKKEKVLVYLEQKYGEEFVPFYMNQSGWGQGHDEIYVYPKHGTKEDKFVVWGTILDDGTYAMRDGYFGVIIKDEYEAVMSGFVKDIYKDFKLFTFFGSETPCPDRLNKDTKISDIYREDEPFSSDTLIFVKESSAVGVDTLEALEKIAQRMKESKLAGEVSILVAKDDKFEQIDSNIFDKNFDDYLVNVYRNYIWVDRKLKISEAK